MLDSLCKGVGNADMLPAFQGLLEPEPHVRVAAVTALPFIPHLAERKLPFLTQTILIAKLHIVKLLCMYMKGFGSSQKLQTS